MKTKICLTMTAACLGAALLNAASVTHYVALDSPNPTPPFLTWATAATNIQHAFDATAAGDEVVVTNGIYRTGGGWSWDGVAMARVSLAGDVVVRSVNGPEVTVIEGYPYDPDSGVGMRCAFVGDGAVLSGFTLTGGGASDGGGVYSEPSGVVTNCLITGNSASGAGGGAYGGTLYNCTLTGNAARYGGGGVSRGTLYNCTLSGNSATDGGGVYGGTPGGSHHRGLGAGVE